MSVECFAADTRRTKCVALVKGGFSFLHAAVTDSIEDALKAKAMYSDRITKLRQTTQSFESNNAHPELYRCLRVTWILCTCLHTRLVDFVLSVLAAVLT